MPGRELQPKDRHEKGGALMKMIEKLLKALRQLLCEHEFSMFYPDVKFRYEREQPVRYWVCRCRKCGKIIRRESRRTVL